MYLINTIQFILDVVKLSERYSVELLVFLKELTM